MDAVILAGGLGERLRPFTNAIPKPLLPVGEHALLEIQIAKLAKHGCDRVFLATNYKSEYIRGFIGDGEKFGLAIEVSEEREPLGTCGPLSLLRDQLSEPFIVMNGDILTALDFERFYTASLETDSLLTVATKQIRTPFNFGSVESHGDFITGVVEKPELVLEVVAGIYVMKPGILELVPDDTYYGVDQLIQEMIAAERPVNRYPVTEYWLDIGCVDDYSEADHAYKTYFRD